MRYIDRRDDYDQDAADRLPRRPRSAVTTNSYYSSRHSSRHNNAPRDRDDFRRARSDRRRRSESRPHSESRERRRRERRASRYAQDPERELRRQEERQVRRAQRAEQRLQKEERREKRQERKRRELVEADQPLERQGWEATSEQQKSQQQVDAWDDDNKKKADISHEDHSKEDLSSLRDTWREHNLEDGYEHRRSRRRQSRPRTQSWHSSDDDYYDEKHSESMYDELRYYKRTTAPDRYYQESSSCCACRRKRCIISSIAASFIILVIIVTVAVTVSRNQFKYTASTAQVNNTAAFTSGGATHNSVNDTSDGIGAGTDIYKYYQGHTSNFPNHTLWISFEDMWNNNLDNMRQSCGWLHYGADDSDTELQDIYNAIQDRANASLVDHRLVLALVLQESHGCVRVPHTTSSGGVKNTGLMQAHDGYEYSSHHSQLSITAMIQDGTQGTKNGHGLAQLLNVYGNPYSAARGYNSGYIPTSGDLSEAAGATACYVSDVANRLTGWVNAQSSCPGS